MKTQLVQLEPHDNVVSVRDKMAWAKTARILLVWPRRGRLLTRRLDLLLLQRHALRLGAQLGLVTRSDEAARAARELGMPVFATVAEAQGKPWRRQRARPEPLRRAPRPDLYGLRAKAHPPLPDWLAHPAARLTFFTLGALAVIAVVLLFVPSAAVSLDLQLQAQELTLPVSAAPGLPAINVAGSLPAQTLSITVEGSRSAPASGQTFVADEPAQGVARFRNLTASVIGIPAGTVIRTLAGPPVKFATTQDAVLAAGVDKAIDIPIRAVAPGPGGNLDAGTLIAIEGRLGAELVVTNPAPTSGGTERAAACPTDADHTRLRAALLAELRRTALTRLAAQLAAGGLPFPDTLVASRTLAESYQPEESQPGETLSLEMQVEFTVQYALASDLNALAAAALDAGLPHDWLPVADTLGVEITEGPASRTNGSTSFTMRASRMLEPELDPSLATRAVQGLPPGEAARRLEAMLPLASPPRIELVPSWWPWLPFLQFRISLNLK